MRTVTLTPSSATALLSNVIVTPYINGVAQPTKYCAISLAPLVNNLTFVGSTVGCIGSSSIYSIGALPVGQTASWSIDNTSIASLNTNSGSSVSLNSIAAGETNLRVTITNQCGQTIGFIRKITIKQTTPIAPIQYGGQLNNSYCDSKWHYMEVIFETRPGATLQIVSATQNLGISPSGNIGGYIFKFGKGTSGYLNYVLKYSNGCNDVIYESDEPIQIKPCTQLLNSTKRLITSKSAVEESIINVSDNQFIVFPNPSKDVVNVILSSSNKNPNYILQGQLIDTKGTITKNIEIINNNATFSLQGLPKGVYILKILLDDEAESHRIIVE
jgi:Secretion system C-terminal sorting domain